MRTVISYYFFAVVCLAWPDASGQRIDFTYRTYGLEVDADNVIHNAGHLEEFFENLYQLKEFRDRKINIVHVGDSHIQADYLTSVVRRNFHRHFGNAGRGLIVPLRVAGTNEPGNYKSASNRTWLSKRCVFPNQPLPIGIGGVTIGTNRHEADLEIHMNDLWLDYSFNSLVLFYEKDEKSFDFSVRGEGGKELGTVAHDAQPEALHHSVLAWEQRVNAVRIALKKQVEGQSRAIVYGVSLENGESGILYHTIGVNGAKYMHYNAAARFADQTAVLRPDVFIVSLGTNEAIDYPNIDRNFYSHMDQFVTTLRRNNPLAKFILVTPQDVFRQKDKPNPGIAEIREQIIRYAVENGLAFYDMYRALGGALSAGAWRESTLLRSDGVHLTKDGYEYQGELLYHALIKGYNLYVPTRHP